MLDNKVFKSENKNQADANFLEAVIDFFRFYADSCHYGKEENILFKALKDKSLTLEQVRMLDDLVKEYVQGRGLVGKLRMAKNEYFVRQSVLAKIFPINLKHCFCSVGGIFKKKINFFSVGDELFYL